jgi:hypothetical protein
MNVLSQAPSIDGSLELTGRAHEQLYEVGAVICVNFRELIEANNAANMLHMGRHFTVISKHYVALHSLIKDTSYI